MEDTSMVEKGLGIYFITVSCIEKFVLYIQIFWPIAYYIVKSHFNELSAYWIAGLTGIVSSMYSLGQIVSLKPISYLSDRVSFKVLLMIQLLISCIGVLFLGVFPTFYGLFVFRFFGGIGSNTQTLVRKLFFALCCVEKQSWHNTVLKSLWATRIGGFLGIILAGLLSNPNLLFSKPTKVTTEKWFLPSLTLFLLYTSGLLLIFSFDTKFLTSFTSLNYNKMQEIPEKPKETDQSLEENNRDPQKEGEYNFKRFLEHKFEVSEEKEEKKEETTVIEEIKYYSPKHIANKSSFFKVPKSARAKLASKPSAETIEEPQLPQDIKKTHISFIEDDMIDMPNNQNTEIIIEVNENKEKLKPSLYLASIYRVLETAVVGLIVDSIPYTLIFEYPSMTLMELSGILASVYLISSILMLIITPVITKKLPYSVINPSFIITLIIFLMIQASLSLFIPILYLHIFTLTITLLSCDMILPVGCIYISDSVNYSERDLALQKNNFFCLACKFFCTFLSPCAIFIVHPLCVYITCIILATFLLIFSKILTPRYSLIAKVPYQI